MPENQSRKKGHPLDGASMVDKMVAQRAADAHQKDVLAELTGEYARAVNELAASPNGKLFFEVMLKYSGLYNPRLGGMDAVSLVADKTRSQMYLHLVRMHLKPETLKGLEQ